MLKKRLLNAILNTINRKGDAYKMPLDKSIKILREKTLLTQEDLAHELGVAASTVNRWETGKARPNMSTMKAIKSFCETHNFPYDEIERGWMSHSLKDNQNVNNMEDGLK